MAASDRSSRVAGTLVGLVGLANLAVGVASLASGWVRLSPVASGAFIAVGLATSTVAVLVWRGSRVATFAAFTIFTMLLIFQLGELLIDPAEPTPVVDDKPWARLVLLAALVLSCGVAAWRRRRQPASAPPS